MKFFNIHDRRSSLLKFYFYQTMVSSCIKKQRRQHPATPVKSSQWTSEFFTILSLMHFKICIYFCSVKYSFVKRIVVAISRIEETNKVILLLRRPQFTIGVCISLDLTEEPAYDIDIFLFIRWGRTVSCREVRAWLDQVPADSYLGKVSVLFFTFFFLVSYLPVDIIFQISCDNIVQHRRSHL